MNAVGSPVRGWSKLGGFVEHGLERDKQCVELPGYLLGNSSISVEFGEPLLIYSPATQHKGFTDDHLRIGQLPQCSGEQRSVVGFVFVYRSIVVTVERMPDVVDADQDAEDVRFELEAVFIPPFS